MLVGPALQHLSRQRKRKMPTPTISVAMATRNGAEFLAEQLASLAQQQFLPVELLVGDDASSDGTLAMIEKFARTAPFPVRLTKSPAPFGYGENFIRTAQQCRGDWIAFCDQDDVWSPIKLERCAQRIAAGPADLRLVNHEAVVTTSDLTPTGRLYDYPRDRLHRRLELAPEWHPLGFTMLVEGRLIRDVPSGTRPSFPWHKHRAAHDVWAALLANATGSIALLAEPLAYYRRHAATVTADPKSVQAPPAIQNNGAEFALRRQYLTEVCDLLANAAGAAADDLRPLLLDAAQTIGIQAHRFELRHQVYCASDLGERLGSLARLFAGSGYAGREAWPFGARRLLKDLLFAIKGSA